MKKIQTYFLITFIILSISTISFLYYNKKQQKKEGRVSFFVPVPISKFSDIQTPCVEVQIEDTVFTMAIDLGMRGVFSMFTPLLDQIPSKQLVQTKPMYGIRGAEYHTHVYEIPKASFGKIVLTAPIIQDESVEWQKDSIIVPEGEMPSPSDVSGRIGWPVFSTHNLLLDTKHSKIAFCDSLETLKEQGYAVEHFIQAPFSTERGLIEFTVETSNGLLLCVLDTGCTWNIVNKALKEDQSFEQAAFDPENVIEYPSFKIGKIEFGPIYFRGLPIKIPIHVEAILGMEFIRNGLIFIDFSKNTIYFMENSLHQNAGPTEAFIRTK